MMSLRDDVLSVYDIGKEFKDKNLVHDWVITDAKIGKHGESVVDVKVFPNVPVTEININLNIER